MLISSAIHAQGGPLSGGTGLVITASPGTVMRTQYAGTSSAIFTVSNRGSSTVTGLTMSCAGGGSVTCVSVSPRLRGSLVAGDSFEDTVRYDVGAAGLASVKLIVTLDLGGSANGVQIVQVAGAPTITIIAPVLTSGSRALVRTRQPIIRATFLPNFSAVDTTGTVLVWRAETVTQLDRAHRGLVG